jgi:hypothetical protein
VNTKPFWIGLAIISSLALAQSAPKAVLLRLEPDSTVVVGALEGNKWVAADKLSAGSQNAIKAGLQTTVVGSSGVLGKALAGGTFGAGLTRRKSLAIGCAPRTSARP